MMLDVAAPVPSLSFRHCLPDAILLPWRDGDRDSPAAAAGRALLTAAWERLAAGAIECIDVHFRSGGVVADLIAVRLRGPIAEATTVRGAWTHAFALDEVALVRGVGFGRFRD